MKLNVAAILTGSLLAACSDTVPTPPVSLNGPTAIGVAMGRVCLNFSVADNISTPIFGACREDEKSAIGLVVNENSDRLTFIGLNTTEPRLADLTQAQPGVSHLPVGRLPVDVAASPDGTVAYTLNQIDRDISVVNLWGPEALDARIALGDTPIAFEVSTDGTIVVAMGSPSQLAFIQGVTCETDGCTEIPSEIETLAMPGTISDFVITPDGARAFVAFRDFNYIAVVDIASRSISNLVGASNSCSDGVDNDGDGRIDQDDPQCFGPFGSEIPVPATETANCQDGEDNDEDGLIDRDDPDCTHPGAMEISNVATNIPTTACNDGVDNDGDGDLDYPNDTGCYGPLGRTEVDIRPLGFDAIAIDELGKFVYLVDRANNQVVVIDATREILVNAAASQSPAATEFTTNVGIPVFPRPLDVAATVRRDCLREDNFGVRCSAEFFSTYTLDEVVVRYAYGAFVTEDTGRIRYVEAMDAFCRIPVGEAKKLLDSDFTDLSKLAGTFDEKCTIIPEFPLVARDDFAGTCAAVCDDCERDEILNERFFCNDNTSVIVNPRFGLVDLAGAEGRVAGKGTCEIPAGVDATMRELATLPNAPREFGCTSPLLPQPLSLDATGINRNVAPALDVFSRADLLAYEQAFFRIGGNPEARGVETAATTRIFDARLNAESWTVSYEGALPSARRADGLVATELTTITLNDEDLEQPAGVFSAGYDLCAAGVFEGDLITFLSQPDTAEACAGFAGAPGFLTYRIASMDSRTMYLTPAGEGFATELPTRTCFPTGITYEIRPEDAWIVVGERSGLLSEREDRFGACVNRQASADPFAPARQSRVKTGETYTGPYLGFYLYPGGRLGSSEDALEIQPARGLNFTFQVVPNFASRNFQTEGIFPTKVVAYQQGAYYRVLSTDSNSNFVFIKDARSSTEFGVKLR